MLRRNKSWAIALLVLVFVSGSAFSVWAQGISPSGGGGGAPSGPAGGDLSGTYPNPTVAGVNGTPIPGAGKLIGGDGGSVTPGTGLTISGGTLNGTIVADDCTSGTCSGQAAGVIPAGDANKTVLLDAHAYTLAQAGTAGFTTGFGFLAVNKSTTGSATITATTSVFHAGGETTVLTLAAGDSAFIQTDTDNANYLVGFAHFLADGPAISPTALSGDVNNYNPTGLSAARTLRIDGGAADRNITGLAGGYADRRIRIVNIGSTNNLVLKNNSGSSSAGNKFLLPADTTLPVNTSLDLIYDATSTVWRPAARALSNSGVTAATYGDATHVGQCAFGVDGRATSCSNVAITGSGSTFVGAQSTSELDCDNGGTHCGAGGVTLTDIPGLSVSLVTGKNYNCRVVIPTSAPASGGIRVAWTNGDTLAVSSMSVGGIAGGTVMNLVTSLGTASTNAGAALGGNTGMDGTLLVSTGGTLKIQFAQQTGNATQSKALINSSLTCWQTN